MHTPPSELSLTSPGHFVVGSNYWASHAGAAMWRDWRPEIVADDLRAGWRLAQTWRGPEPGLQAGILHVNLPPNDAMVLLLQLEAA